MSGRLQNPPASAPESAPRVVVLGLGGAGLRAAARLAARPDAGWLAIAGVDCDEAALRDSSLARTFAIGTEWTLGQGCGGDAQRGTRVMAHKSQKAIEEFIDGAALVIVLAGMGGGLGSGGAPVLARQLRRSHHSGLFLVTMPFSFEGHARHETAEEGIRQLLPDADVVVPLPNDLLFATLAADTPADRAFQAADEALAGVVLALAELLRCRTLLAADFADLRHLLGKRKTYCAIGFAETAAPAVGDPAAALLDRLLVSPLLGGVRRLAEADAAIAVFSGDSGFSIGEMKQVLEATQRLCRPECQIIAGATHAAVPAGCRRLTVLAVQFDQDAPPLPDHDFRPATPRPSLLRAGIETPTAKPAQPEFALFRFDRGIFANTAPNIHDGVDLDVPTFQRQEITLDKGR